MMVTAAAQGQRVRKSLKEARPYDRRLINLIRVTWPSTAPELQGRVRPLTTASQSFWRKEAKPWTGGGPWSRARAIQPVRS